MASGVATPAFEVLRNHYGELLNILNALSDPVTIAGKLWSKRILSDDTLQKVQVTGQTVKERNQIILEAVRHSVKTKQGQLLEFIGVLTKVDQQSLTDEVVAKMRRDLSEFDYNIATVLMHHPQNIELSRTPMPTYII